MVEQDQGILIDRKIIVKQQLLKKEKKKIKGSLMGYQK